MKQSDPSHWWKHQRAILDFLSQPLVFAKKSQFDGDLGWSTVIVTDIKTHRIDPDRACLSVSIFPSLWSPGITVPRSWVFCLRQRSLTFAWWSGEWMPKYIGKPKGVKGIFSRLQWRLAEVWRIWLRCLSIGKSNSFREIILPLHWRLLLNLRFWSCAWLWRISGG